MSSELEQAAAEQQKFQYYATALVFTFLAASLHSADLASYNGIAKVIEALGWLSLLISGVCMLLFLEGRGNNMRHIAVINKYAGKLKDRDKFLSEEEEKVVKSRSFLDKTYEVARVAFALGVVAVVLARIINGML